METTAVLRRRIETAEELRSVTGTMKGLAAVTITQYQRSVHAVHQYNRTVELGLQILLRAHPELLPASPATDTFTLFVVFGSARGLCGPLNRRVAGAARTAVDAMPRDAIREVVAIGPRVAGELEGVGLHPRDVLAVPGSAEGIGTRVEELLVLLDTRRAELENGRVLLVHPRPGRSRNEYEPGVMTLLPLDPIILRELAAEPWPTHVLPMWSGDWRHVFAALTRQFLFVRLHQAHAETQMCVHGARLAAMESAEESIGERLEELTVRYRRRRQDAITNELLDVVSGYEATGGPDTRSRR